MPVASHVTRPFDRSTLAIPAHTDPSEYVAVQCTVQTPGAACFTVALRQAIFVSTDSSLATVPTIDWASATMQALAEHGAELAAATGAEDGAADGADDGAPAAVVLPRLPHPARDRAARVRGRASLRAEVMESPQWVS